jgi:4-amino-4-deoxy-L-arabinose transferase-like glycosyltransferase
MMLDLWTHTFGTSEFALRSLSTLVGLLAISLVYAIGLRLFGTRIAVIGALLLSTSPYFIWYAQEVRYITLLLATSLAMTYSFQRALTDGGRRWWVLYGLSSALALFTFLTVVFLLLAQALYLLCDRSRRPLLKQWVASQVVIIVLFAGWFVDRTAHKLGAVLSQRPSIVSQEQDRRSREKLPLSDLVGTLPYTLFTFSVGFSLGPSLKELHESRSVETLLKHAPALIPVAILFASLFVLGLRRLRRESGMDLFFLLWLGVPVVGVFIVATTTTYHVYNTRYVAMALPAYLLILATGIAGFRSRAVQGALLAAVIAVNGLSLFNYYFDSRYARADARAAAEYLVSAARPGDAILSVGSATALRYYYKGKQPITRVNSRAANSVIVEDIRELGKKYNRLWLVEIRPWESDPKAKVRAALDKLAGPGERKIFAGADIYAYDLARAGSSEQGAESRER